MTGEYESFLQPNYRKQTPEQRKRAQEFAYALMKQGAPSPSWGQPIADVLKVIAGQHMLRQTSEAEGDMQADFGRNAVNAFPNQLRTGGTTDIPKTNGRMTTGAVDLSPASASSVEGDPSAVKTGFNTTVVPESQPDFDMGGYLKQLARIESSGGTKVAINDEGYGGPFGFRPNENEFKNRDWKNDQHHVEAAIERTKQNIDLFTKEYGRPPNPDELYLMHNQGASGAMAHINAGERPAWINAKEAAGGKISNELAVRRISKQISDSSPLKKKAGEITSDQFKTYLADKFNGGWGNATKNTTKLPGQIGGGAVGKDTESVKNAIEGTKLAQATIPPPVGGPTQNANPKAIEDILSNPTVPWETKQKYIDQLSEGAEVQTRDTATGKQDFAGNDPNRTSMPGGQAATHLTVGKLQIPQINTQLPNGKGIVPQWLLPDGNLVGAQGLLEFIRREDAKDTKVVGTAGKEVDHYEEEFNAIQDMGIRSRKQIPLIDKMYKLASDERFYSGIGDEKALDYKKLLHAAGINPGNTAPNEVFNKIVAGTTIGELSQFDKRGRVLATEFDQLKRSLANSNVTQPAILDLLHMSKGLHEQATKVSKEAREFTKKKTHGGLDKDWDSHIADWYDKNQIPTRDDIERSAGTKSFSRPGISNDWEFNQKTGRWEKKKE